MQEEDQEEDQEEPNPSPLDRIEKEIDYGYYLLGRGWFLSDKALQQRVLLALDLGLAKKINPADGDFAQHIDNLIDEYQEGQVV